MGRAGGQVSRHLRRMLGKTRGAQTWLLLVLIAVAPLRAKAQQIITTVAGTTAGGAPLGDGGPATSASLNLPSGVAVDGSGNIFIADTNHHRIREVVAATGIIQTVAGNGVKGYGGDGGLAINAELNFPAGVAVDRAGNIYIADTSNSRVREVTTATGIIQTVAGNGMAGGYTGDGGPATSATLNGPRGLFVDNAGNIFIGDLVSNACCIREVTAAGIIQTVVGKGTSVDDGVPAASAAVQYAYAVAVDSAGNIFYAEGSGQVREVVAATGLVHTVAGTNGVAGYGGDGGPATSAEVNSPRGVAVDSAGNIFLADHNNNRIREVVAATGIIRTVAGTGVGGFSGDGGPAVDAELCNPLGIWVDPFENIFIADSCNSLIRKVFTLGGCLQGATTAGLSATSLSFPGQVLGTASAPQTVTLSNAGNSMLCISNIAVTGTNGGDFTAQSHCPQTLAVGASCPIPITFTPSATGSRAATLIITDNAADSPQSIALSGTGGCDTTGTCLANVGRALPAPGTAAKKAKRETARLQDLFRRMTKVVGRAAASSGKKQHKQFVKARHLLEALLATAQKANRKGTLGVPLAPLQAAVNALLAQIPS